ncbi:MAG: branched-subunit amino acid aminotransferase/4-amino-4-deoxychorismate lyase [Planctomycetota bacterium]|jgi:branched-subunit amino acid aminotransferase/4-amino-4-deoxychorismate lyase
MTIDCTWLMDPESPVRLPGANLEAVLEAVGTGVYEGFRTHGGIRVYLWGAHLLRLEAGRAALGLGTHLDMYVVGTWVSQVLDQLAQEHPNTDFKVRLDLADGDLAALGPAGVGQRLALQAWPVTNLPEELLRTGVSCALERQLTREQPEIKGTDYSLQRARHPFPGGENYESILISPDGYLLEGVMSGLVLRIAGELRTAGLGVLPSITVSDACGLAEARGLTISRKPVHLDELDQVTEAFLASSVRFLVPIVNIDGRTIGDGTPGELTLELRRAMVERASHAAKRPDFSNA